MSADATGRPAATVVIPARNAAETLGVQLGALCRQVVDVPWEVVVVDNGSTDGTVELARSYADRLPRLRVVPCDRPGANAARNAGAAVSSAPYLLFCDADDEVDERWVAAVVAALHSGLDAVGGRIDDDRLNGNPAPARVARHPRGLPRTAGFLPRAITANFGVRRDVWAAVGGFSEDYEYGCTDTEFCWRVQLASYRLGYADDAVVAYRHRDTLRTTAVKAFKTGRSRARLFRDFHPHGMPKPRLAGVVLRWGRLAAKAPLAAVSSDVRWWWVREISGAAGRVVGSLRFRVRYL